MKRRMWLVPMAGVMVCLIVVAGGDGFSQPPGGKGGKDKAPGGKGGPGGFGPPGFGGQEIKLVAKFDTNGDGWLNKEERQAAREFLKNEGGGRGGFGGPKGGFGGPKGGPFGKGGEPGRPGPKVSPADVKNYPD